MKLGEDILFGIIINYLQAKPETQVRMLTKNKKKQCYPDHTRVKNEEYCHGAIELRIVDEMAAKGSRLE